MSKRASVSLLVKKKRDLFDLNIIYTALKKRHFIFFKKCTVFCTNVESKTQYSLQIWAGGAHGVSGKAYHISSGKVHTDK